jgi:hypothetical protein
VGVVIVAWAASYLGAGRGEKEFQKTLDAMKQVHSFRVASTAASETQHNEMLWEVDCNRDILHRQWHMVDTRTNPPQEINQNQIYVAGREYARQGDGSWAQPRYASGGGSARWFCSNLAQGTDSNVLPQIATMIKRGILQKGDKKTVNGVRCREWLVTMKGGFSGLEHDTVCLGLQDHLPYEMTVDWEHSRSSFSDYNSTIQFDVPEAALHTATASAQTEAPVYWVAEQPKAANNDAEPHKQPEVDRLPAMAGLGGHTAADRISGSDGRTSGQHCRGTGFGSTLSRLDGGRRAKEAGELLSGKLCLDGG